MKKILVNLLEYTIFIKLKRDQSLLNILILNYNILFIINFQKSLNKRFVIKLRELFIYNLKLYDLLEYINQIIEKYFRYFIKFMNNKY